MQFFSPDMIFFAGMRPLYKILFCLGCLICCTPLWAQQSADSLPLHFRQGYAVVDSTWRENTRALEAILFGLTPDSARLLVELRVTGNASPDGTYAANVQLSQKRASFVRDCLRQRRSIPDSILKVCSNGIDWAGLIRQVESDSLCPARDQVLQILRNTPEWIYDDHNRIVDGRKHRLMGLRGGVPYNYMLKKHFPDLRRVDVVMRYKTVTREALPEEAAVMQCDSLAASLDPDADVPLAVADSIRQPVDTLFVPTVTQTQPISNEELDPLHRMAIKTNLLYDAILMPSLEVEYRIDNRWSVALEGSVAWWSKNRTHKYYQIATIIPEGRYWFRTRKPWHGHYVGLFAGGSWYDLENGARGYKGEFFMTGISYGYMFPIGRSLSLEAGIGVGFLRTTYEEYLPIDGHYVYQQTSRTNWFGPVRLKFALVWRLWDQNRRAGR